MLLYPAMGFLKIIKLEGIKTVPGVTAVFRTTLVSLFAFLMFDRVTTGSAWTT
jgi:hypothetical protein